MQAILVAPDGTLVNRPELPAARPRSTPSDIQPTALLAGEEVSGRRGDTVFLAMPTPTHLLGGTLVVIATDRVDMTVLHDALPLMRRSRASSCSSSSRCCRSGSRAGSRDPIHVIERAAAQLATGDLSARADVPPTTDDELAALADALNDMAAQLERSRGSEHAFLLSISHDLRTPLTSIRGYAEALADGTLDDADPERSQARRDDHRGRRPSARTPRPRPARPRRGSTPPILDEPAPVRRDRGRARRGRGVRAAGPRARHRR